MSAFAKKVPVLALAIYAMLLCGSGSASRSQTTTDHTVKNLKWQVVTIEHLPDDDQALWNRYHTSFRPGEARVTNECLNGTTRFSSEIATNNGISYQRVIAIKADKLRVVFGPDIITTPFVIWTSSKREARDLRTGIDYKLSGQSLIYEKLESVAYMIGCSNNQTVKIHLSD